MKKNYSKTLLVGLIVVLSASMLVGCSSKVSGRYTLHAMESGGQVYDAGTLEGLGVDTEATFIEFNGDSVHIEIFGVPMDGSFTQKGKEISITLELTDMAATIDSGIVSLDMGEVTLSFKK